jgi:hypothetical protein
MKKRLGTVNAYLPRAQKFTTSNSQYRTGSGRVALPDVASKTTLSHGQATQGAAKFGWTHLDTPILVWHEDKIRAGNEGTKEGQGIAMGQLIDEATEVAIQDHIDKLANDIWTGNPSSQNADLWDAPLGLVQAVDTANTYGRRSFDRSPLARPEGHDVHRRRHHQDHRRREPHQVGAREGTRGQPASSRRPRFISSSRRRF